MSAGWSFGPDLAWQQYAACRNSKPQVAAQVANRFFPEGRPSNESKRTCVGCPVREQCLQWALDHDEQGVWGGMSEREREQLRLQRSRSR